MIQKTTRGVKKERAIKKCSVATMQTVPAQQEAALTPPLEGGV